MEKKKNEKNKSKDDKIILRYPLEFYYPKEKNLSFSEKSNVLKKIREISEANKEKINPLSKKDEIVLFNMMMEDEARNEYFDGVRAILNLFFSPFIDQNSQNTPSILYKTLYPNTEDYVKIFQYQFSDACDLILLKDKVDWDRMNLSWYKFKVQEGFINE